MLQGFTDRYVFSHDGHTIARIRQWPDMSDCVGITFMSTESGRLEDAEEMHSELAFNLHEGRHLIVALLDTLVECYENHTNMKEA